MKIEIKGIHCKSCKMLIEDVMDDLEADVKSFTVDEKKQVGKLEIESSKSPEEIKKAIEVEGEYTVVIK